MEKGRRNMQWKVSRPVYGILRVMAMAAVAQAGPHQFNQLYNFEAAVGPSSVTGSGNSLYGATQTGGSRGRGSVYALTAPASHGGPWTYTTLYDFGSSPTDGIYPFAVAIGGISGGLPVLYGTTEGGGQFDKGTVFALVPPQTAGGAWAEHILHSFDGTDGWTPLAPLAVQLRTGQLPILYGTTGQGGASGSGAIFSLTPAATPDGIWTENVL
jgi:uncharacterized repeat protein (TIGR03803 family)